MNYAPRRPAARRVTAGFPGHFWLLLPLCAADLGTAAAAAELAAAPGAPAAVLQGGDWPWWRGPTRDGVAPCDKAPTTWGEGVNIRWKTPVPGRGHSSPTVVGDRVFLTTADEKAQVQSVLCFGREDGAPRWKTDLFRGGFETRVHKRNSQATSTVACDGERLYVGFLNADATWLVCLDLEGEVIWKEKLIDFESHWGLATSPVLYGPLVVFAAEHRGMGALAALDRVSGEIRWKTEREAKPNHATPAVVRTGGRDQLLMPGIERVASYDPVTGKELWSVPGTTKECVGTMVASGDLVFASGGWPKSVTVGLRADTGKEVWKTNVKVYVPSLLAHRGHIYAFNDAGVAYCWKAETGEVAWRQRLADAFSASPVLVGDTLYVLDEFGTTHLVVADPSAFTLLGENRLGDDTFVTPAICGGRVYYRAAHRTPDGRREFLYCIAE